jgi:hypothetical protein
MSEKEKGDKRAEKFGEKFGLVVSIAIQLLILWVMHNLTAWDYEILDFVKDDFNDILWVVDLSVAAAVMVDFLSIFIENKRIRMMLNIFKNIFSFYSGFIMIRRFPFDFRELIDLDNVNFIVKLLMGLGMFGVAIATVVNFIQLLTADFSEEEK